MSKQKKLESRIRNNPGNVKLEEFVHLLQASDWDHLRTSGGHQIWSSPEGQRFVVSSDRGGNVPQYQVKEFIATVDKERVTAMMRDFKKEFAKQNNNPEVMNAASSAFMKTMEKSFAEGRVPGYSKAAKQPELNEGDRPTTGSITTPKKPDMER